MKKLLYKEFLLVCHPTVYLFMMLGAMLLIPSYIYYVVFFYTCLGIFFTFLSGRENRDIFFSVLLPVRKRDVVTARCIMIVIIEVLQVILSIPFAILGAKLNPNPSGNLAGIEANVAFYGLVFVMYAIFNAGFLLTFYKTAYKVGSAMLAGMIPLTIFIVASETLIYIPGVGEYLDTTNSAIMVRQLPLLFCGILIYLVSMIVTCKRAAIRFEKVDL